jgi:hypothetical protein
MLDDLESIHKILIEDFKALCLLSGVDLDALTEKPNEASDDGKTAAVDQSLVFHLPI